MNTNEDNTRVPAGGANEPVGEQEVTSQVTDEANVEAAQNVTADETATESTTPETDSETSDADDATQEDSSESTEDETGEPVAVVDEWAAALTAADPDRFAAMTQQFANDEPFSDEDIAWVSEINKSPSIDATRYVLELQRSEYKAQMKADTSIADAEAIVGNLDTLIDFAKSNAPAERVKEWQTIVDFAHRTGDDAMMLGALKEMKAFKDSIPGNKPKTLGHLAATQVNTEAKPQPVKETAADTKPATDPRFAHVVNLSSQALANIVLNASADPAAKAAANAELSRRGL